jgi:alpha-tubulin suppressor-like RCC1 family protein
LCVRVRESFAHICLLGTVVLQAITSGAQPVTKIAAGISRSLLLKSDGTLWTVGYVGPLEMEADGGTNNKTNQPPQPPQLVASNVTAMAAGGYHTLFLKSDGSLWAKGANQFGQLGDGTYGTFEQTNGPEQIVGSYVIAIVAGNQFSLFLKRNGSLWGMGWNSDGQLGDGTSGAYAQTNRPEQIVASNVTAIAAGGVHSLFVKSDGSLWTMGYNVDGQLGNGTYGEYDRPGTIRPQQIIASNVTAIAAGNMHSLFLKSDGSLWAMGSNAEGKLGDGHYNNNPNRPELIVASNVTAIAAGSAHSLFLKSDGSLWGMGLNFFGQLGYGTDEAVLRPVQIVASNVTAIAAGGSHSLFLKTDGSLWAMGWNKYGQLGDGTTNNTNRSKQIVTDPTKNNFWRIH